MNFSEEQQQAIDARNCNLLVSAAAGSGKTAVLIERLTKRVLDDNNPVDIDSLVVVTFTKAAAEEMKTRLIKSFETALKEKPGDSRISKQIALVDNAQITTIDSFCSFILKNYYNSIDVDPSYRIADEGELNLIKEDAVNELLEEKFIENSDSFIRIIDAFSNGKNFEKIKKTIKDLQRFSESCPWPEDMLNKFKNMYNPENKDEFFNSDLIVDTYNFVESIFASYVKKYNDMLERFDNCDNKAYEILTNERNDFTVLSRASNYQDICKNINVNFDPLRLPKDMADEDKEFIKAARKVTKDGLVDIKSRFFPVALDDVLNGLKICSGDINEIIDLTLEFDSKYKAMKSEKNIMSFSDVEHFALRILVNKDDEGNEHYTEIADELSKHFEEIYIDEYQDSNDVQETILTAVSRCRFNQNNIFMVGDVKQSIYKFRMAKPELFIKKYVTYKSEGDERKIELHQNFRSNINVINTVNDIFYKIMHREIGKVEYDESNSLKFGGLIEEEGQTDTEIVTASEEEIKEKGIDMLEAYATLAAMRIKDMMAKDSTLHYKDFTILLRSDKKPGLVYADTLINYGIPTLYNAGKGYFDSYEIRIIMDLLKVIDNPRQEIPLVSVMRSFFAYFTTDELSFIKGKRRKKEFYDCIVEYASENKDDLAAKCSDFLKLIENYRKKSMLLTTKELISEIIFNSGYYDYVGLMSGGNNRKANLDVFISKAGEYEKTSFSGLFNFIRYIDDLIKFEVDYGEAQEVDDALDMVRIMSIHKSKGLQFKIVILGNTTKKYNESDTRKNVIIDGNYGIGVDCIDIKKHIKYPSLTKSLLEQQIKRDMLGEELRLLYVALTRAIQKIIILAIPSEKDIDKYESLEGESTLDTEYLYSNKSYADLILGAYYAGYNSAKYNKIDVTIDEIVDFSKEIGRKEFSNIQNILSESIKLNTPEELTKMVQNKMEYKYPFENISGFRAKYSVSDIKHKFMDENEEEEAKISQPEELEPIPCFLRGEKEIQMGIIRGNAVHKFFEIFDYEKCVDMESITRLIHKLPEEYRELINPNIFIKFLETDLGKRMKQAALNGNLFREQPFIMEISGDEVDAAFPKEEKAVVQGIVDAFFFENNKVVVVDYKTDNVSKETVLIDRYKKQLQIYAETLVRVTGKELGGCYLYSTHFNKEISIL